MKKKIASLLLIVLLLASLFSACATSQKDKKLQLAKPDKIAIAVPEALIPKDTDFYYDDETPNKSSAYFEKEMPLEDVQAFYKSAFASMGAHDEIELNEAEIMAVNIVPEPEAESTGKLVWLYYAKYDLLPEQIESVENANKTGHLAVICTQDGAMVGVEVAVAYRAKNIATIYGLIEEPKV